MDDWTSFSTSSNFKSQSDHTQLSVNNQSSSQQSSLAFTQQHFQNAINMSKKQPDEPQFQLEQQPDTIDSTTGQAVCFATAANWIIVGTTFNNLIRWYIGGDQDEKNMICVSNKPEERIFEIFISPNGKHILISMVNGTLYYIPTSADITKPTQIQKFNEIVQSVAWFQYDTDVTQPNITNPVQHVLLGTTTGALWELTFNDVKERSLKKLYELHKQSASSTTNTINRRPRHKRIKSTDIDGNENNNNDIDGDESDGHSPDYEDDNGLDMNLLESSLLNPAPQSSTTTASLSVATAITGIRVLRANIDNTIRTAPSVSPTATIPNKNDSKWHLLFVTSSHEYKISGGPTIEAMFSSPNVVNGQLSFIELPGGLLTSNQLATFTPIPSTLPSNFYGEHLTQSLITPSNYGWLTAAGVYYAHLDPNCPTNTAGQTAANFSHQGRLIEYPKIVDQEMIAQRMSSGDGVGYKQHYLQPISILITQFHIIFLFRQHLAIVNLINATVVMSCPLPKSKFGATRKLGVDETNNSYWLLTDTSLYEIFVSNEGKDIWRLYLTQGDYENAYLHCTHPQQSKIVSTVHADALFQLGDYTTAAQQYIRSTRTFEAVCMKYLVEYQHYSTSSSGSTGAQNGSIDPSTISSTHPMEHKQLKANNAVGANINAAMPNSLFSPTISSLFGPGQLTSNSISGHKLFSTGGSSNPDSSGDQSNPDDIFTNPQQDFSSTSLSSLLSMTSSSSTFNSTDPSAHTANTATDNSLNYLQRIFHTLEQKWSIYAGLKTYLKLMLAHISQSDKTKLTTLATWVTEISVNTLVSLQTSFIPHGNNIHSSSDHAEISNKNVSLDILNLEEQRKQLYEQETHDLEELMMDYLDCLHPTTTYQLLSIAGRTKECLFFAKLNKHYQHAFDLYLREHLFLEAIEYLRTLRRKSAQAPNRNGDESKARLGQLDINYLHPPTSLTPISTSTTHVEPLSYTFTIEPDIVYRIIPTLLQHYPAQLVDILQETDGLLPSKVLTAMVSSGFQIEFTTSLDSNAGLDRDNIHELDTEASTSTSTGVTTIVDPSKQLLQNTFNQFGINLADKNTPSNTTTKSSQQQQQQQRNKVDPQKNTAAITSLSTASNIKSISINTIKDVNNPSQHSQRDYLYHISRYLIFLISQSLAPPAAHNLYVAILIQLLDPIRLYNYLIAHKHTTSPNRAFALRLALPHIDVLYSSVIELCLQLQRYTLAIRFAMRYDNPMAKKILRTMTTSTSSVIPTLSLNNANNSNEGLASGGSNNASSHASINVEQSLWQEYVQLLFSRGLTISQIITDIRSWFSDDNKNVQSHHHAVDNSPLLTGDSAATTANNTTLLKILPALPTTITISDIQSNVITQLVDFNTQLNQLNLDMSALHLTNNTLKQQLHTLQKQIVAISTAQRCDICSQPVMLSPFIYFRCGHVFHLLCCVNTVASHLDMCSTTTATTPSPTSPLSLTSATNQLVSSLVPGTTSLDSSRPLSKKQTIYLELLNNIYEDLTTTASLSQTAAQDIDQSFCSDEMMDLITIQQIRQKVLTGSLTQNEELFFIEEYAQQSCCHCGDLMIESISLGMQANTASFTPNIDNSHSWDASGMDWSL